MDSYLGMIMAVAFPFAPRNWMKCEGQLININQNSALFSLLGTQYGGDGVTTFALPDLRARTLVGAGQGPGINVIQGEKLGAHAVTAIVNGNTTVTLDAAHLPAHHHSVTIAGDKFTATSKLHACSTGPGTGTPAAGSALGASGGGQGSATIYVSGKTLDVEMDAASVTTQLAGSVTVDTSDTGVTPSPIPVSFSTQVPINVMQPSLGMNYVICVQGIFPSRN